MKKIKYFLNRLILSTITILAASSFANAASYPNSVGAAINLGISQGIGGLAITSDNRYLFIAYGQNLKMIDLGTYALAAEQPPELTEEAGTLGVIKDLAYSAVNNSLYAVQDDGDLLIYNVGNITAQPSNVQIKANTTLFPLAIDDTGSEPVLYIGDNADELIYVWKRSAGGIINTISLTEVLSSVTNWSLNDLLYVNDAEKMFMSVGAGYLLWTNKNGSGGATAVTLPFGYTVNMQAMAALPNGSKLYAIDSSENNSIEVVTTSTNSRRDPISIRTTDNTQLTGIVTFTGSDGFVYGFCSGLDGVSVWDTTNDLLIDQTSGSSCLNLSPSDTCEPIQTSYYGPLITSADGYIYMSSAGGELVLLTENPVVDISSVKYFEGSEEVEALHQGGTVQITWTSNQDGTYKTLANGSVDESGSNLTDVDGKTSGTVTADATNVTTFAYDTNQSVLEEGDNNFFFFVKNSQNLTGRLAAVVNVDTPPPAVVATGTSFGNTRAYLTFNRLTPNDMSYYNIYVDTDPDEVQTKTDVAVKKSQPSSGSKVTAEVTGLTNGTLYYMAVEGVDAGGNVGPRTHLLPDGTPLSAMPQLTVGPAGYSGEKGGCSLVTCGETCGGSALAIVAMFMASLLPLLIKKIPVRFLVVLAFAFIAVMPKNVFADNVAVTKNPQWWSSEFKVGFWMPQNNVTKKFFNKCCNLVYMANGGFLYDGKYGIEGGVGFMYENGWALGESTGERSGDRFNFIMVPMETTGVWRMDYAENQIVVPYIKAGVDYVYYRESVKGETTQGLKTGLHGAGGMQFSLDFFDADASLENDYGVNNIYFVIEARYNWINSFGKKGLNLSSTLYSAGILVEF